jgi:drug/metabolite transporter (DMT)-like permease
VTASRRSALLAILVAAFLWGVNWPVMKFATARIDPFFIAGIRMFFGAAAFYFLLPRERRAGLFREGGLRPLLVLSVTGIVINQAFVLTGLERTTPGHAALLMALIPIQVALLALRWLRERMSPAGWLGILLGAVGAAGVVSSSPPAIRADTLLGDGLVLVATLAFAVYTVLGRDLVRRMGARRVLAGAYLGSLPAAAVLLGLGYVRQSASTVDVGWEGMAALAYVLVVNTVACYLLYFWALHSLRAAEVAICSNLQPVLGTALSAAVGMDVLGPLFSVSALVVLAGVWLVQSRGAPGPVGA